MKSLCLPYFYRLLLAVGVGLVICASVWAANAGSMGYVEGEDEGHTSVLWTAKGHRLMNEGDFEAALECFQRGEREFAVDHDTIDKRFVSGFLAPQADILRQLGRADEALAVAYRIFLIRDSLSSRSHSGNQERAEVVGTAAETSFSTVTMAIWGVVSVAMIVFFGFLWQYNRRIREKNKALASTVERLRKSKGEKPLGNAGDNVKEKPQVRQKKNTDEQLFVRLTDRIVTKKMYLTPNLSRADVIVEVYVPKNKFASLFQRYAGMSFTYYINSLRVKEAMKRIKEHPEYTFESIASECGIGSLQSFNRVFLEHTGMTPSEYRQQLGEEA